MTNQAQSNRAIDMGESKWVHHAEIRRSTDRKNSVIRLPMGRVPDLTYDRSTPDRTPPALRDALCSLCEQIVSVALSVSLNDLRSKTRKTADVALARQTAMYLCHTSLSLLHTEIGLHFKRDRTTVSHACRLVEDKREEPDFDLVLCQLETLLRNALYVSDLHALQVEHAWLQIGGEQNV